MKTQFAVAALLAGGCLLALSTGSVAQQNSAPAQQLKSTDVGKTEFEAKCATCHGLTGKDDGPTAAFLTRKPADLTVLAKNNNGVLPIAAMYDVIMGKKEVAGHGTREMPVWGAEYYELPYVFPEAYARARVLAVIEYIYRLQDK